MARTDTLTNFLTDIANSIRNKKGSTDSILASNFDTEIESIETGGGEPTIGVQFTEWDEQGYPVSVKFFGTKIPPYLYAVGVSNTNPTATTPSTYNHGLLFKLNEIDLNNIKIIMNYAFYYIRPNSIIGLNNIESVGQCGIYLYGGLKKFCLPNIRELDSTAISQVYNSNQTYVWLGSSIKNDDYKSILDEPLWVDGYLKIVDGQLVDSGANPGSNTEIGYVRCSYNKIFDINEFNIDDNFEFSVKVGIEPIRRAYVYYDENYNRLSWYNDRNVIGQKIKKPPENAKYITFHIYNQQSAEVVNTEQDKIYARKHTTATYYNGICIAKNSFVYNKTNKIYIDLPRSVVETSNNYQYGFQNTDSDASRAKIVCNDDDGFLTKEEFEKLVV